MLSANQVDDYAVDLLKFLEFDVSEHDRARFFRSLFRRHGRAGAIAIIRRALSTVAEAALKEAAANRTDVKPAEGPAEGQAEKPAGSGSDADAKPAEGDSE